jgi:hypothetical protein
VSEKSFLRRRRIEKVARRATSGYEGQNIIALKGRKESSAAPSARESIGLFQTLHVWLPSSCRFAAKIELFRDALQGQRVILELKP